jgi:hypothetical protein
MARIVGDPDVVGGAVEEEVDRFERIQLGRARRARLAGLRVGGGLLALHRSLSFS